MGKYFGTDGFRGEAGIDLTADHAYKVGRFLGLSLILIIEDHIYRLFFIVSSFILQLNNSRPAAAHEEDVTKLD